MDHFPTVKQSSTYPNAVVKGETSQLERLEQLRGLRAIRLGVSGRSRRGFLGGSEVRDTRRGLVDNIREVGARHVAFGCSIES